MTRILLLGGTAEANRLAQALAARGCDAVYSYAGRVAAPRAQPLPTRAGGFGGVAGLADYLRRAAITHVIDATHPFAARISANAIAACARAGVPLCACERAPWRPGPGDRWTEVADYAGVIAALPAAPQRVFLAIGRQTLAAFAGAAQHSYLVRLVDPPEGPLPLADVRAVIGRGPFTPEGDRALLQEHGIGWIVTKNSGGEGARAKLIAARELGLPVILLARPALPGRLCHDSVAAVLDWIAHAAPPPALRGV